MHSDLFSYIRNKFSKLYGYGFLESQIEQINRHTTQTKTLLLQMQRKMIRKFSLILIIHGKTKINIFWITSSAPVRYLMT